MAAATCLLAVWALVAAGLFGTGLARASFAPAAVGKEQREFDYFALALQWPGTICSSTRHCCAVNGCCRKEPLHTFTIHGLWPDYDDGTWPSCCRHTSFDMDKITPLKPTLDKYWPSLYCSSSSTCFSGRGPFWAHEWEKHGTCSAPAVQEELQYFSTALDLYFKYNVTSCELVWDGGARGWVLLHAPGGGLTGDAEEVLSWIQQRAQAGLVSDDKLVDLLDLALSADTANTVKALCDITETGVEPLSLMSQLATIITDILAGTYTFAQERIRRKFFKRPTSPTMQLMFSSRVNKSKAEKSRGQICKHLSLSFLLL